MSTNAVIGMQFPSDDIKSILVHSDGYPKHTGAVLIEHYSDANKVDMLINLGDISFLGPEVTEAPKEVWGTDEVYNFTSAYHRDKGEELNPPRFFTSTYFWLRDAANNTSAQYGYLYVANQGWVYYDLRQPQAQSIEKYLTFQKNLGRVESAR